MTRLAYARNGHQRNRLALGCVALLLMTSIGILSARPATEKSNARATPIEKETKLLPIVTSQAEATEQTLASSGKEAQSSPDTSTPTATHNQASLPHLDTYGLMDREQAPSAEFSSGFLAPVPPMRPTVQHDPDPTVVTPHSSPTPSSSATGTPMNAGLEPTAGMEVSTPTPVPTDTVAPTPTLEPTAPVAVPTDTPTPEPNSAPSSTLFAAGPAATYSSSYDSNWWYNTYMLYRSWGQEAAGAPGPSPYGYYCVSADIDLVGVVLILVANGVTITCVTGDTVQEYDKPSWRENWAIELSWDAYTALGLGANNYVEVYIPQ